MAKGRTDLETYIEANIEDKHDGSPQIVRGIERIEQFVKLANYLDYEAIFRGQRCDWPLVPAVGRSPRFLSEEQHIFSEFKREALPYLRFVPNNCWQWLAVAQHNRLPTRFLDWTKSPLVALWFAVSETAPKEKPGIVWACRYTLAEAKSSSTPDLGCPFSIDRTFVYHPEHVFQYIQAQSGIFTVHHKHENRFVPLEEVRNFGCDFRLMKIEIPGEHFWHFKHQLYRLGVHAASLFPGLDGLVQRIKYDNDFSDVSTLYHKAQAVHADLQHLQWYLAYLDRQRAEIQLPKHEILVSEVCGRLVSDLRAVADALADALETAIGDKS